MYIGVTVAGGKIPVEIQVYTYESIYTYKIFKVISFLVIVLSELKQ